MKRWPRVARNLLLQSNNSSASRSVRWRLQFSVWHRNVLLLSTFQVRGMQFWNVLDSEFNRGTNLEQVGGNAVLGCFGFGIQQGYQPGTSRGECSFGMFWTQNSTGVPTWNK